MRAYVLPAVALPVIHVNRGQLTTLNHFSTTARSESQNFVTSEPYEILQSKALLEVNPIRRRRKTAHIYIPQHNAGNLANVWNGRLEVTIRAQWLPS
jgi:hypothetical protein